MIENRKPRWCHRGFSWNVYGTRPSQILISQRFLHWWHSKVVGAPPVGPDCWVMISPQLARQSLHMRLDCMYE